MPWRVIGGRAVVINPVKGEVHELNETATFLWESFDGTLCREGLTARLCAEFSVAPGEAKTDVDALLASLHEKGLLGGPQP